MRILDELDCTVENIKIDKRIMNSLKTFPALAEKNIGYYHDKIWYLIRQFFKKIKSLFNVSSKITIEHYMELTKISNLPREIFCFIKPLAVIYERIPSGLYGRKYYVFGDSQEIEILFFNLIYILHSDLSLDSRVISILHNFSSLMIQNIFDYLNQIPDLNDRNYCEKMMNYCDISFSEKLRFFIKSEIRKAMSDAEEDKINFYFNCNNLVEFSIFNERNLDIKPIKAMIEYLICDILNVAGQFCKEMENKKITLNHLYCATKSDRELSCLPIFEDRDVILNFLE